MLWLLVRPNLVKRFRTLLDDMVATTAHNQHAKLHGRSLSPWHRWKWQLLVQSPAPPHNQWQLSLSVQGAIFVPSQLWKAVLKARQSKTNQLPSVTMGTGRNVCGYFTTQIKDRGINIFMILWFPHQHASLLYSQSLTAARKLEIGGLPH